MAETCKEKAIVVKTRFPKLSNCVCVIANGAGKGGRWGWEYNCVCVPVDFLSVHNYSNGGFTMESTKTAGPVRLLDSL